MKRAGLALAGLLLLMLVLEVVGEAGRRRQVVPSGQGGGECICLITETAPPTLPATWTPSPTPTSWSPTATATIPPSPTRLPTQAITSTPDQCWHRGAAYSKGWQYVYRDFRNTGLRQNLRRGPNTSYPIVGTLLKDQPREIYYLSEGWAALSPDCGIWAYTALGEFVAIGTD